MYGWGNSLGLGTDLRVDPSTGQTIDCDSWGNFFNGTCWGILSSKGTTSYVYGNTPYLSTTGSGVPPTLAQGAAAPPIVPGTVSTLPAGSQDNAVDLPGQLVAQQTAQNQNTMQSFFASLDTSVQANQAAGGACSQKIVSGVCDWITLALGGVAIFGLFMMSGGRR